MTDSACQDVYCNWPIKFHRYITPLIYYSTDILFHWYIIPNGLKHIRICQFFFNFKTRQWKFGENNRMWPSLSWTFKLLILIKLLRYMAKIQALWRKSNSAFLCTYFSISLSSNTFKILWKHLRKSVYMCWNTRSSNILVAFTTLPTCH